MNAVWLVFTASGPCKLKHLDLNVTMLYCLKTHSIVPPIYADACLMMSPSNMCRAISI